MNTNLNKRQYWKTQIDHFKNSGLSIRKFCIQEGHNEHTFGYWLDQHGERRKKVTPSKSNFLPVVVSSVTNENHTKSAVLPDPKWVADFLKAFLRGNQ
jgi:hypothetical protein